MTPSEGPCGFLIVDKATGMTSHDVVARLRRRLGTRKVGHAGTLDPDATGVLVVGVGRATRLMQFVTGARKSYVGEVVLGVETSTLDAAGEVVATYDMSAVTASEVAAAASELVGDIDQVPPMVSAVKVAGRRLHELARAGEEVERTPRPVTVHSLATEPIADGVYRIDVECSSGTYVRTLAADLGTALGGGAHLRALQRTAVGSFTLAEAEPWEAAPVQPPAGMVRDLATLSVGPDVAAAIGFGKVLAADDIGAVGPGPWAVVDVGGELLAVYERHRDGDRVKPTVVVRPAP